MHHGPVQISSHDHATVVVHQIVGQETVAAQDSRRSRRDRLWTPVSVHALARRSDFAALIPPGTGAQFGDSTQNRGPMADYSGCRRATRVEYSPLPLPVIGFGCLEPPRLYF